MVSAPKITGFFTAAAVAAMSFSLVSIAASPLEQIHDAERKLGATVADIFFLRKPQKKDCNYRCPNNSKQKQNRDW